MHVCPRSKIGQVGRQSLLLLTSNPIGLADLDAEKNICGFARSPFCRCASPLMYVPGQFRRNRHEIFNNIRLLLLLGNVNL
jgi:hypothetical protein